MAIIEAERPYLPLVRRLEAAGFRAWPAAHVSFDGSWQLRLTPGHPSKRLNSLVPLDPLDERDMAARVALAERAFDASGIRIAIRQSPLCPPELLSVLEGLGWHRGYETLVMTGSLDTLDIGGGIDHLPTHDVQRFAEACVRIDKARDTTAATVAGVISAIEPTAGLFLMDGPNGPTAVGICVQDFDLAGIQQVAVEQSVRRQGLGRELVSSALRWGRLRGARQGWLQVLADNSSAISLYQSMGFTTAYSYAYWQKEAWS
jgi:ribosomal protein S18 acetylase RimI-like enzyme